ncbi:ATP-binding cassette domain-containing protein [Pseudonocardia kujensis]|uniref:ABC transporter ATP-binding protein n=1 Tax=Pseudonocardia kujensis TaxID=1128675 RepID=UPI001E4BCEFF|nr:ATP-binding cassette domain-containing protein [Pseudonocardia kujensis]MCE0766857.1 ATP-binding cassette domain-containing protein [Pseudonocardia kujensis]
MRLLRQRPAADPVGDRGLVQITGESLEKTFVVNRARHRAVAAVDVTIGSDRTIGVIGESGSGKSTLARMLSGLEQPDGGTLDYNGVPLGHHLASQTGRRDFRRAVQLVSQDVSSSFDPLRTLRDAVRTPAMVLCGLESAAADQRVDEVLETLQVSPAMADRRPHEVSGGGQRQRFAIARALVVRPRVLLCDEVVSALDVSVQGAVLNMLKDYVEQNRAGLFFVSHGIPATAFLVDELIVMQDGEIVERGSTDEIVDRPQHEYTRFLVAAARRSGRIEVVAS